jgi:hypothetical protein
MGGASAGAAAASAGASLGAGAGGASVPLLQANTNTIAAMAAKRVGICFIDLLLSMMIVSISGFFWKVLD